eukprot:347641_1
MDLQNITVYKYLNDRLKKMSENNEEKECSVSYLANSLHINPYFHGNRSPLSNPSLEGMMVGMKLNDFSDIKQCAIYYLATLQALCYDSKFILDTIMANGVNIKCVFATGGLSKNELFIKLHSDITQIPIILPKCEDSVLIGASVLGLLAHKNGKLSFSQAMSIMNHAKYAIEPTKDAKLIRFHFCKYKIFRKMIDDFEEYQNIMNQCQTVENTVYETKKNNKIKIANTAIDIIDDLTQMIDENQRFYT